MADAGFEIPEENVFDLVLRPHGPPVGLHRKVTDWYTANPDFEHVAFTAIDFDLWLGRGWGPCDQGRGTATGGCDLFSAGADDEASRNAVRAGEQDMSVAFFRREVRRVAGADVSRTSSGVTRFPHRRHRARAAADLG